MERPANTGGKMLTGRCRPKQNFVSFGLCKCFKCAWTVDREKSFPTILRRVENPVHSFGFIPVHNPLPPPLLDGIRESLGKPANLPDQLRDGQPD
jgi:hypothetical protein